MDNYTGNLGNLILWLCAILCFGLYLSTKKRRYNLPPGPMGLPFLGISPFLGKKPHLELTKLGKKYGGIFGAYFGRTYTVVVTDVAAARLLLSNSSLLDRPPNLFQLMPDGLGFAELNGPEWVEQRRFSMTEMKKLGLGRSTFESLIQIEISDFLDLIEQYNGEPFDIHDPLGLSITNNIQALVSGQRLPLDDPRRYILEKGSKSVQELYVQNGFIFLYPKLFRLLANLGLLNVKHHLKNMMNLNKLIRQEIDLKKKDNQGQTFIEKYLMEMEKNKLENGFHDTNLLGNIQTLLIAGSDTVQISLLWLFMAMASFSDVQSKVHYEIDTMLEDSTVHWSDRQKLQFCLATIMEGQRWRTIASFNLLHRTSDDVEINGYVIPKGADVLTVLWAFHHDSRYWKDPDTFQPERFLSDERKVIKEPDAFLPFSYGKRFCPGKTVAYIEIFLYFVSIMRRFKVLKSSEEELDLEGQLKINLRPKRQPLRFVRR